MPDPHADESESDYVSRFMASPEARKDFPDEKQRAAVAYKKWRERNNFIDTWGVDKAMSIDNELYVIYRHGEYVRVIDENHKWNGYVVKVEQPADPKGRSYEMRMPGGALDVLMIEQVERA